MASLVVVVVTGATHVTMHNDDSSPASSEGLSTGSCRRGRSQFWASSQPPSPHPHFYPLLRDKTDWELLEGWRSRVRVLTLIFFSSRRVYTAWVQVGTRRGRGKHERILSVTCHCWSPAVLLYEEVRNESVPRHLCETFLSPTRCFLILMMLSSSLLLWH